MSEIRRARDLRAGDTVIGRFGSPFPVPLTIRYLSVHRRSGLRLGPRLHWTDRRYASLNALTGGPSR
jgi:hypothetical protein